MLMTHPVIHNSRMAYATEPVSWVFADECHRATRRQDGFVTPTGAVLRRLFLIGVLTEVHVQNSRAVEARVSDPTGGFSVSVNHSYPLVADLLAAAEPPAFIALAGELAQKGREEIRVIADACQLVSREDRDRFICLCAEDTIRRLSVIDDGSREYMQISEMVTHALYVTGMQADTGDADDQIDTVVTIIEGLAGTKGAALDAVIAAARGAGLGEEITRAVLTRLLEEGDCYMPTNGTIKLV